MTRYMQDLLVSYAQAVVAEVNAANDESVNAKRLEEARTKSWQRRARLVDAIEKLEEAAMPAKGRE